MFAASTLTNEFPERIFILGLQIKNSHHIFNFSRLYDIIKNLPLDLYDSFTSRFNNEQNASKTYSLLLKYSEYGAAFTRYRRERYVVWSGFAR